MLTESELYKFRGKDIKITCIDGEIIEGFCSIFTKALDNEPEIASITIENSSGLIEVYQNEIKNIETLE